MAENPENIWRDLNAVRSAEEARAVEARVRAFAKEDPDNPWNIRLQSFAESVVMTYPISSDTPPG